MIDDHEKSTGDPGRGAGLPAGAEEVAAGLVLDPRLALFHRDEGWLAVSDLHFGYEVSRRRDGGLWPLWGMETIEARLRALVEDWRPESLVLAGDIVDSGAAPDEATLWLDALAALGPELVLIAGNHDRGPVRSERPFVTHFETERFFLHHGHEPLFTRHRAAARGLAEIHGHLHPAIRLDDGAGTSLRLPALVRERRGPTGEERWVLPAFSPWAGGGRFEAESPECEVAQWACGAGRVFRVE